MGLGVVASHALPLIPPTLPAPAPSQADPNMAAMMKQMEDPEYKAKVEATLSSMKEDPELKPMMEQLEKEGPMARMK